MFQNMIIAMFCGDEHGRQLENHRTSEWAFSLFYHSGQVVTCGWKEGVWKNVLGKKEIGSIQLSLSIVL